MTEAFNAFQGGLWVQLQGANTEPMYLGCHQVDDIEVPDGDVTVHYCPDPADANKAVASGSSQGVPGTPSTSVEFPKGRTLDWLEQWRTRGNLIVHKMDTGRRDQFLNFQTAFVQTGARRTSRSYNNVLAREQSTDETMASLAFSFERLAIISQLTGARQGILAAEDLLAVGFWEPEGNEWSGTYGVVAGEGAAAATAELYFTADGGQTWAAAGADPFAVDMDIAALACISLGPGVRRVIAGRSTTIAATPAGIAYSDDDGDTWSAVVALPTADTSFVTGLFAASVYDIYAITDAGEICYSNDSGLTWVLQEDVGALLNDIHFYSTSVGWAVGAANEIQLTEDGGTSWTDIAGPAAKAAVAINAVEAVTAQRAFIGYADGDVFYTEDGGESWAERNMPGDVVSIAGIEFVDEMVGYIAFNDTATDGHLLRTHDGGYNWETISRLPPNDGVAALAAHDVNGAYVVGGVIGAATAFVGKVFPAS